MTPVIEKMTVAEFLERYGGGSGDKYNRGAASRRRWNGRTYDSIAEMRYAQQLHARVASGDLLIVIEQPRLWLGVPENVYVPDFFVLATDGRCLFVDVKGSSTAKWRRDMKLWAAYGPAELVVIDARTLRTDSTIDGGGDAANRRSR